LFKIATNAPNYLLGVHSFYMIYKYIFNNVEIYDQKKAE